MKEETACPVSLPRGQGAALRREIGSKGKDIITSLVKGHVSPSKGLPTLSSLECYPWQQGETF